MWLTLNETWVGLLQQCKAYPISSILSHVSNYFFAQCQRKLCSHSNRLLFVFSIVVMAKAFFCLCLKQYHHLINTPTQTQTRGGLNPKLNPFHTHTHKVVTLHSNSVSPSLKHLSHHQKEANNHPIRTAVLIDLEEGLTLKTSKTVKLRKSMRKHFKHLNQWKHPPCGWRSLFQLKAVMQDSN